MQISMKEVVKERMSDHTAEIVEAVKDGNDFRWLEDRATNGLYDDLVSSASDLQSSLENISVEDIKVNLEEQYDSEAGSETEDHFGFNKHEACEMQRGDEWDAYQKKKLDELVEQNLEDAIKSQIKEVLD